MDDELDPQADAFGIDLTPVDPVQLAWCELSDLGNAERLKAITAGRLAFVDGWGWIAYDDTRWSAEHGERLAALYAHQVAKGMRAQIDALISIPDKELPEWCSADMRDDRVLNLRKWSVKSGDAGRTTAMLQQASHLLSVPREAFDREPFALNVRNGTLRIWREGPDKRVRFRLDPHDPADRITRVCAVVWDPAAECPKWNSHIETALPIERVRLFFQDVIGYSFTGSTREQMAFFCQGRGGDGKSTALNTLRNMADSYGLTADVKSFLEEGNAKSGSEATPDIFRMQGDTRFISTAEPKRGQALAESRMKALTGGGRLASREPYGRKLVEFVPRGKLLLECNSKPRISGDDDGIWRRIIVIMFPHQFKGKGLIKGYEEQLVREWPGILNWVLAGMARWIERGQLDVPPEVIEAVEDYRRAANPFGEWFAERVDVSDPLAKQASSDFYADYKAWCDRNSVGDREILSTTKFGIALGDRQLLKWKGGDGRVMRRGGRIRPGEGASGTAASGTPAGDQQAPSEWGEDDDWPV
ncbi:phage/plasmid primase, P4 family [Sphingomonas arantia]|uniref:Phage/plasmid primase, P4 family n=1 Tax=Sphingomonas arantia TaxID=1460676 RepID=A0ABW4TZG0_9SPHN